MNAHANVTLLDGNNTFTAVAEDGSGRKDTNSVTAHLPASPADTRGNDLSGTRDTAGGIGGMLARTDNARLLLSVLILILAYTLQGGVPSQVTQDDPHLKVDIDAAKAKLREAVETGVIRTLEVMHVSTGKVFRVNVSSSLIESVFDYNLVERSKNGSHRNSLCVAVEQSHMIQSGEVADLRWGAVLYDETGNRIFSIYFDETGERGVMNGACVSYTSHHLRKWAMSNFGSIFTVKVGKKHIPVDPKFCE
jgi:hypothetical protein